MGLASQARTRAKNSKRGLRIQSKLSSLMPSSARFWRPIRFVQVAHVLCLGGP